MSRIPRRLAFTTGLLVLATVIVLAACSKSSKPSAKLFASPDEAGSELLAAIRSGDRNAALAILGPDSNDLIDSGDAVQDKTAAQAFAARYDVMHRWRNLSSGDQLLLVGADNFAFPIPLKRRESGQWSFDAAAGRDELLSRRIGRNELATMEACRAFAEAQALYFSQLHDGGATQQYAAKFISDAGRQNGLYWEAAAGQPQSPLGPMAAFASAEGYSLKPDAHKPFNGYYLRILTGQTKNAPGGAKEYVVNGKMVGGFALIAYPAEYGNSGVMTFLINQDGVLLQKDLGKTTTETATAMSGFDPDGSWVIVEE